MYLGIDVLVITHILSAMKSYKMHGICLTAAGSRLLQDSPQRQIPFHIDGSRAQHHARPD